ncbi:PaaI family thioesterase [Aspergillus stella-maris]|uniref:PaaI family thioesterase n=1 Tax=Aspergillus stella-maris TaxID=1810926 RepID=UPI003CCE3CD1
MSLPMHLLKRQRHLPQLRQVHHNLQRPHASHRFLSHQQSPSHIQHSSARAPANTRSASSASASKSRSSPSPSPSSPPQPLKEPITTPTFLKTPAQLEHLISSLPLIKHLRQNPLYTEFHPMRCMHPHAQKTHLVTTAFLGNESKIPVEPIYFLKSPPSTNPSPSIISPLYLSTHLTGHAGFIHGGLLSVLFDDIFARLASEVFPSRIGMTVRLEMEYKAPAVPGRVYIARAEIEKVEERKVWVGGEMRCLGDFKWDDMGERGESECDGGSREEEEGVFVARGRGLFVEPRNTEGMVPLYPN